MADTIDARGIEFVETIGAVDDERGLAAEFFEDMRERLGKFGVINTRELDARASRVGERTEDVEDGALTHLFARTNGIFHGGMKLGREHEADADLLNGGGNLLGRDVEIDAEGRENIGTAALGGSGAVAVLGNFTPCACEDERSGGGDVEGVCTVAACADDVVNGFGGIEFDFHRDVTHGANRACDLGDGLAFHAQRGQIRTDLSGSCAACHDDSHRFFGFRSVRSARLMTLAMNCLSMTGSVMAGRCDFDIQEVFEQLLAVLGQDRSGWNCTP